MAIYQKKGGTKKFIGLFVDIMKVLELLMHHFPELSLSDYNHDDIVSRIAALDLVIAPLIDALNRVQIKKEFTFDEMLDELYIFRKAMFEIDILLRILIGFIVKISSLLISQKESDATKSFVSHQKIVMKNYITAPYKRIIYAVRHIACFFNKHIGKPLKRTLTCPIYIPELLLDIKAVEDQINGLGEVIMILKHQKSFTFYDRTILVTKMSIGAWRMYYMISRIQLSVFYGLHSTYDAQDISILGYCTSD